MDEIAALAAVASATVVSAMATETWQGVRERIADLFHRYGGGRDVGAEMDRHTELVAGAPDQDEARQVLHGLWALELTALVRADEACYEPLLRFVNDYEYLRTRARDQERFTQTNIVPGSGALFAVQRGDLHIKGY